MFFSKKDSPAVEVADLSKPTAIGERFYAIYDVKGFQIFQGILRLCPSDGVAIRWFTDLMCHKETTIHQYPTDFVLVRVGFIDQDTLAVQSYGTGFTDPVITGAALLRQLQTPTADPNDTQPRTGDTPFSRDSGDPESSFLKVAQSAVGNA